MYSFILQTDLVYCCPFSFIHSLSFGRSRSMSRSRPCSKVKYIYDTACCKNSNSSGYNAGKTYLDDWFMLLIAILSTICSELYDTTGCLIEKRMKVNGFVGQKINNFVEFIKIIDPSTPQCHLLSLVLL